jgi:D-inositol-3-phosphate glycosyltransferase
MISHLIDDCSPGGVVRFLDWLQTADRLGAQTVVPVRRGSWSAPQLTATMIVSHLVVSWRNLPFFMALRRKYPSTPIIHVEHSYSEKFADLNVGNSRRFKKLLRVAYSLFDRVVAVSEEQANWLRSENLAPSHVLRVITPVVDLSRFLKLPLPSGPIRRIGAIGRLHPQKGFDILITAFRKCALAGMELHVYGDGPERSALQQLASGDSRIIFHGFADPVDAMEKCDVVAVPSRYEPFGLVALEARAAGRTVLTSGVDGLADQGNYGAISVGRDADAWQKALLNLQNTADQNKHLRVRDMARSAEQICFNQWLDLCAEFEEKQQPLALAA